MTDLDNRFPGNSREIENACTIQNGVPRRRLPTPEKVIVTRPKKKYPSLNNTDLQGWGDECEKSSDDEEAPLIVDDYFPWQDYVNYVDDQNIALKTPELDKFPPLSEVVNLKRDGFVVLDAEKDDDWSVLDDDDDEVSSQWTSATDNHGTFLKALVFGGVVPPVENSSESSKPTKNFSRPQKKDHAAKSDDQDQHIDFEGEYLSQKGRAKARGKKYRKGRG
jgi:hypothetical protein